MKKIYVLRILIILFIVFALDFYVFHGLKLLSVNIKPYWKLVFYLFYWLITIVTISGIIYLIINRDELRNISFYSKTFMFFGFVILFTVPKLVFLFFNIANDLLFLIKLFFAKYVTSQSIEYSEVNSITRSKFLLQIGIIVAAIPFASIIYGVIKGRYNFQKRYVPLNFPNLPNFFNGLKIVQLSDFHIGSFTGRRDIVTRIIDMVNAENPDLILFTGDLVNNLALEADEFKDLLENLKSKYGKFSILGNHDYGDYMQWTSQEEKEANLNKLKQFYKDINFKLLLNEHIAINIETEQISLIGVENWGHPPFPQYGNLSKAISGCNSSDFKILLSHDPSHWDAKVIHKTNIDLTLSGHTHGMQFGVEIGNFKWSPVKWKYPRWAGLYSVSNQYLYVNRGVGYIGYPGRVGIMPEISIIKLYKS